MNLAQDEIRAPSLCPVSIHMHLAGFLESTHSAGFYTLFPNLMLFATVDIVF
jgi:hypothetical protein